MLSIKGWFGEKINQFALFLFLDDKTYTRFHDVVVPTENGTTQIDHIIVSRYGVFVIETIAAGFSALKKQLNGHNKFIVKNPTFKTLFAKIIAIKNVCLSILI